MKLVCSQCGDEFQVTASDSQICPECAEELRDNAALGKCEGCLCKIPVNRAYCDECEPEVIATVYQPFGAWVAITPAFNTFSFIGRHDSYGLSFEKRLRIFMDPHFFATTDGQLPVERSEVAA